MRPNISAALLVLLLPFVQFQPTVQTRTEHELSLLKDVIVANTQQYFLETKDSKEQSVLNTRDQLLKIVLHDYGMKGLDENALSTRAISNHLAVRRKSIAKHRSNKIPFKKMQASRKKQGLSKQSFIFQHNPLCQLMVQFWNEHSTPSPNKKDVNGYTLNSLVTMSESITKTTQRSLCNAQLRNAERINAGDVQVCYAGCIVC